MIVSHQQAAMDKPKRRPHEKRVEGARFGRIRRGFRGWRAHGTYHLPLETSVRVPDGGKRHKCGGSPNRHASPSSRKSLHERQGGTMSALAVAVTDSRDGIRRGGQSSEKL